MHQQPYASRDEAYVPPWEASDPRRREPSGQLIAFPEPASAAYRQAHNAGEERVETAALQRLARSLSYDWKTAHRLLDSSAYRS